MTYSDGQEIRLREIVCHADVPARIVAVSTSGGGVAFEQEYAWVAELESSSSGEILFVVFANGALVNLVNADEDLKLMKRSES